LEPSRTDEHEHWHGQAVAEVVGRLHTDPRRGLTIEEAARRLAQHGPNRLPPPARRSVWVRFLLQFHNVLIYMMLGSAVVAGLLSHWIDAAVLFAAVVVNAVIGFIQEGKAEEALDAIRNLLSLRTTAIRQGERIQIAAEDLVQGDLVTLASGDKIPADLRVVGAKSLFVNEAILTGESAVVEKTPAAVPYEAPLGDRRCLLYSGTLVSSGQGTGIVVATASRTELGRISVMLEDVQEMTTPLVRQMAAFSRWLATAIGLIAVSTFFIGVLWRGHSADDMFMMVVALAASSIPEGLPAIMTITLALGVRRMATRNAIVRRLPAVETLGSVTVICSDKTGTLTKNEMTVQSVLTGTLAFDVSGAGYVPEGGLHRDGAVRFSPR
jgi:magnesium-transporting ATPase (P-type)